MNRIIIRKAKFSELSRITAITKWAYRALNKNATLITKPHEPKELNEQFQKKEFFVLVCLVNGKIIGAIRYFFDENNNLYFFKLAVLKTYRDLGAGTLLIKAVEGAAIKKGSKKIFLDCAKEKGLEDYYKRFGFKIYKTEKKHNHTAIYMSKNI